MLIPTRSVSDENYSELFNLEIQGDQIQIRKIISQLEQIKYVIKYFSKTNTISDYMTIRISLEFLKKYHSDFLSVLVNFLEERIDGKPKYPVHLQFCVEKKEKQLLEEDLSFLGSSLRLKIPENEEPLKTYELLLFSFLTIELNQDLFSDFISSHPRFQKERELSPELEGDQTRCCGVCGSEVQSTPFSFYGRQFSAESQTAVCGKCLKFYEMSLNTKRGGWRCLQQSGYCALLERFQYHNSVLLYPAPGGVLRQYASNCNVLCKLCRFRRCLMIGLSPPHTSPDVEDDEKVEEEEEEMVEEEKEETPGPRCQVCRSQQGLNSLEVCGFCLEFLTDSVAESSHTSMACVKSGDCSVSSAKTQTFSACPACWMSLLRKCGVLEKYLASRPHQEEKEREERCEVCERQTSSKYKDLISLCETCKKFFLKCAKSRCYKDFCCGASSPCDLSLRSPCPHCWWRQCVSSGLYQLYQQTRQEAARRQEVPGHLAL